MSELKIFESPEFGTVRTVTINGEPWLVGKDVAEALGYSKPHKAISCYVDGKDKTVAKVSTSGGDHAAIAINETGVYNLALNSPLNNAKDVTERLVSYFKESACKCSTGSSTEAAFFALSKAYAMSKKDAVQLVEKVRAEFCNQDHFDQVVWDLSCAVLECVAIENRVCEFDIHQLFRENYSKVAAGKVVKVKCDPHNIPDAWVEIAGVCIPVEMKLHNFNQAAVDQLRRYIDFYKVPVAVFPRGIAVGASLTATLPQDMIFISLQNLLDEGKDEEEARSDG